MDYIDDLFKALTPISQDLRKRVLEKCKELTFDTKAGIVSLDEALINLIETKNILMDFIENRKLIQLPITVQKDITSTLNEITKFIEGLNAGTNHVENIVYSIEKLNVLVWQYGFHNLSDEVLGYLEKMNQLKIQQTELSKLKDEAEKALQKKVELDSLVANISKAYENVNAILNTLTDKEKNTTELLTSSTESSGKIKVLLESAQVIDESLSKILEDSKTVESDINSIEKNITAFSKKIDEYKEDIDATTDKANLMIAESTAAINKDRSDVEKFKEEQKSKSDALLTDFQVDYESTIKKWHSDYSAVLDKIEDLLPRALTTGLSYAYSAKKTTEEGDFKKYTENFKWSIGGMVCVSLIPFFFSILRLVQKIPIETVIFDIPRVVLAILPLYVPVVWLAYSANKKMNLSKRLIEEYTHKEVLSKTFEGTCPPKRVPLVIRVLS